MSELSVRVRNYPSSFSKSVEFIKHLSRFSIGGKTVSHLVTPNSNYGFNHGGTGGIPLYFDTQDKRVYVDSSDKHSVVIGTTASKKSRLVAMPSVMLLGAAGESMIISDPKAEIYLRTATYLEKRGYNVQLLNLRMPQCGQAWNPLYVPYVLYKNGEIDRSYEFANDIAVNLTNIDKSQKEAFWDNSAGSFFFGLILLLFKYCSEHDEPIESVSINNIIELRNVLCSGTLSEIRNNPLWTYAKTDSFIASALIGTIETANDTRAGILSTFDQKMRAFSIQPSLVRMLSHNDIDYTELTQRPSAIFLILPDEKTGYHGLASLFIKQSYEYLIFEAQKGINCGKEFGNRINYILDEFSSLPTISDFPAMITAARSRNIRFNLFLQSRHQMKLRYGDECETILSNCENWVFLASRELELLKEISELCGTTGNTGGKPLLSVTDLQRLDKQEGEVLILSGRNKPFISKLADISLYEESSLPEQINRPTKEYTQYLIDFSSYIKKNRSEPLTIGNIELPKINYQRFPRSPIDLDEMIKKIDKQLEELAEQEQQKPPIETYDDISNRSERGEKPNND